MSIARRAVARLREAPDPRMANALTYHLLSGQAFFTGTALVVLGVLVACRPPGRWRRAGMASTWPGLALVAASTAPLPAWFYGMAGVAVVAWLAAEGSAWPAPRWARPWLRGAVLAAGLAGLAMELPFHLAPSLPRMGRPTVFVVGDSISAGLGGEAETWPAILARRHGVEVRNLAVAGAGVAEALRDQAGRVGGAGSLVVVEVGGNDLLGGASPDDFARGLDALLGRLRRGGRAVVMLELPLPPTYHRFGSAQRRLARRHGVPLVPRRVLLGVLLAGGATLDTIHLSGPGHERMAEATWRVIGPAFGPAPDRPGSDPRFYPSRPPDPGAHSSRARILMPRRLPAFAGPLALAMAALLAPVAPAFEDGGKLELRLRSRVEADGQSRLIETPASWDPKATAIIVCDMWDSHHCLNAVRREKELAPVMERVLKASRDRGVAIIHAPSSCTEAYKDHPARKHALATPRAGNLPRDIASWCKVIPSEEKGTYPIDQSDGGEDDDPAEHKAWAAELAAMGRNPRAPWKAQIDVLTIADRDYVSDSGEEIWSILEDRGIKNVILMGVHLNMCVLGRPFGLRQMARNGRTVALMRDMTDTMYNPERSPHVSHFAGTDLMVEHVEKYVAPTITSDQVLGGKPFRFKDDRRPTLALVIADDEYRTEATLPAFATGHLLKDYRLDPILAAEGQRDEIPGLSRLLDADLMLVSARRRVLPADQVAALRAFVAGGKPVVGIRTASHAFAPRAGAKLPPGRDAWGGFDAEVLGGNYHNHHKVGPTTALAVAPGAASHPVLDGVEVAGLVGHGSLYLTSPLASTATPLLIGSIPGQSPEPVAWVNAPGTGNRVFYTSLGQADDFAQPAFRKLLKNAIDWAAGKSESR